MNTQSYDLVVIGSGPGGEVGAIRAAQLGMKVALVEKSPHLGGTCLNVGCVPTKALLHAAKTYHHLQSIDQLGLSIENLSYDWHKILDRKEQIVSQQRKGLRFLMKKNHIDILHGVGKVLSQNQVELLSPKEGSRVIDTKKILIASGSIVKELPFAKTNDRNILSSDSILFIDHVPKSLAIIGGGVIGMEFAFLFSCMGTQIKVVELAKEILPGEDQECVVELKKSLKKQGVLIETSTRLISLEDCGDHVMVQTDKESSQFSKALVAIGRSPCTQMVLEKFDSLVLEQGFIPVNTHYQTSMESIYAIGDVIATPALAHTASAEAIHAVEHMAGKNPSLIDYSTNPTVIYTYPEIARIGLLENELKQKGQEFQVVKFPFAPMAKSKIEQAQEGFVKIIYGKKHLEILGVQIVGAKASELIAELALGKVLETTVEEVAATIHPHPTFSETIMETAHMALGGGIHI